MDVRSFLESGMAERYCMNETSDEDNRLVAALRAAYPEIDEEIQKLKTEISASRQTMPAPLQRVKYKLMRKLYENESEKNPCYAPLMDTVNDTESFRKCLEANAVTPVPGYFDDAFMVPLPSTNEVENFAIWLKDGLPEEVHYGSNEYVMVFSGSCTMNIGGVEKKMAANDMACIPPGVLHSAVITSDEPMFAFVQRQLIAA